MIDRLPPQSLEAEQSVLGAMLIDRDAVIEVAEFLRPADFYRQANGRIYAAVLDLFERREPIDIVTVAESLERRDELEAVGGRAYLSSLSNETPTAVHVAQYARIVERKAVLRNLIGAAGRIAGIGYEDPPEIQEAIDRAEAELFAVSQKRVDAGFSPLKSLLHDAYDRLDYLHAHRGEISGVRTGLHRPRHAHHRAPEERSHRRRGPAVGRQDELRPEHRRVRGGARAQERRRVQPRDEQGAARPAPALSSVANIDSQRLRSGFLEEMDFARIAPAMNALSEAPMYIDDTPNISAMELRTKARRLQAESGLDLVIVDYLQLMQATTTNRDANRVQEVSEISRGLKALARELSVPVIALSQLSRQPEMRESKEPRLSDLRESGAIEQDADLVMFLWRDKERGADDQEQDGEVVKLKLAKHRNGPTGEIGALVQEEADALCQLRRRTLRGGRVAQTRLERRLGQGGGEQMSERTHRA